MVRGVIFLSRGALTIWSYSFLATSDLLPPQLIEDTYSVMSVSLCTTITLTTS